MWEWLITTGTWISAIWILATLIVGLLLFIVLRRKAEQIVRKLLPEQLYKQLGENQKVLRLIVVSIGGLLIALAVIAVVVANFGVDITPALAGMGKWLLEHAVRILIIIVVGYLIQTLAKALIPWLIKRAMVTGVRERHAREELNKRSQTLSRLFVQTMTVIIIFTIFFMILSEVGIDIAPLLAGAGIAGIAIGFGAQSLIKDLINGIFIIAENQFNVGDVVRVADIAGLVEGINLRRTVLRDLDGIVHSIPNGQITTSSNFTKEWSRVNLNIPVAYGEDLDRCMNVINKVGIELAKDDVFGPMILTPPKALRVDNFGDSGIEIKILGETKPIKQWDVMGELRRRLKKAFDEENIEIPWPHVKLYFGDDSIKKWLANKKD